MIKTATKNYGFSKDDVLDDTISMFCVIFNSLGEIFGPLFVGFLSDYAGIQTACNVAALLTFWLCIVFVFGTGAFFDIFARNQKIKVDQDIESVLKR